ncbi:MAG: hypothetical protein A4S09_17170 [Proteobacteria bacterium SG_bin7]|nr:MAG: hypothetical protein A4S09_17170 [Proteobacteria bacterium SG_bin7]
MIAFNGPSSAYRLVMTKKFRLCRYLAALMTTFFVPLSNAQTRLAEGVDVNTGIVGLLQRYDIVFLGESHANAEQISALSAIYSDPKVRAATSALATEMVLAQDQSDFEAFLRAGADQPLFEKRIKDLIWYRYQDYRNLMHTIQRAKWNGCGVDYMDFIHAGSDDRDAVIADKTSVFRTFPEQVQKKMAEKLGAPIENVPTAQGPDLIREFIIARSILNCIDRFGPKLIVHMGSHHGWSLDTQIRPEVFNDSSGMPALDWIHLLRPKLKIAVVHLGMATEKTEGESPFDSILRRANLSLGSNLRSQLFSTRAFSPEVRSMMSMQQQDTGEVNTYPLPYYGVADYWIFGPPGRRAARITGK